MIGIFSFKYNRLVLFLYSDVKHNQSTSHVRWYPNFSTILFDAMLSCATKQWIRSCFSKSFDATWKFNIVDKPSLRASGLVKTVPTDPSYFVMDQLINSPSRYAPLKRKLDRDRFEDYFIYQKPEDIRFHAQSDVEWMLFCISRDH